MQCGQRVGERVEQALVEFAFARHRSIACAQHLVLERLEFAGDVTLGVLDRLAPYPVRRDAVGLAATHFDEVALHAVVAEAQVLEAGAFALAGFEIEQRFVAVLADASQLVEVCIEAGSEYAAFAQQRGRHFDQRLRQVSVDRRMRADPLRESLQERCVRCCEQCLHFGQAAERRAQLRQVARPCGAQRNAREDAFDVTDTAQQGVQRRVQARVDQRLDCLQPQRARFDGAQRPLDPAAQLASTHRRGRAVEHVDQRAVAAARQAAVEFEVAAGGGVEQQRILAQLGADAAQVGQGGLLSFAQVVEQAARGADRERLSGEAETGEVAGAELFAQLPLGAAGFEMPRRALPHAEVTATLQSLQRVFGKQQFRGAESFQLCGERFLARGLQCVKAAARELEPGEAETVGTGRDRGQQRVATFLEQRVVGDGARRDDTHHLPFDRAFRFGGVTDLFADRDRLALAYSSCKVIVECLDRHARHRDRLAAGGSACGQRDVEQSRGLAGVVEEQLVEIPHPIEQQHVRVLRLDAQVLGHDGGVGRGLELFCHAAGF